METTKREGEEVKPRIKKENILRSTIFTKQKNKWNNKIEIASLVSSTYFHSYLVSFWMVTESFVQLIKAKHWIIYFRWIQW